VPVTQLRGACHLPALRISRRLGHTSGRFHQPIVAVRFRLRHADVFGSVRTSVSGTVPFQLADQILQVADADWSAGWHQVALIAAVGHQTSGSSGHGTVHASGHPLAVAAAAAHATSQFVVAVETSHGQVVGRREVIRVRIRKRLAQFIRKTGRAGTALTGRRTPQSLLLSKRWIR
jgi:hypothetical protein